MSLDFSRLSILVADDDQFILTLTRSLLNGFGISDVRIVSDSHLVLDHIASGDIDIVLLDWDMSPLNGLDLTRKIRLDENSPDRYLPIIIMTGHTEMSLVLEARDAGVTEFLAKPMTVRSLYQRLLSVIERPRPFVRASDYFGPDRRRFEDPNYDGPERRAQDTEDLEI
jgi:CheY-like chemotaxis protein